MIIRMPAASTRVLQVVLLAAMAVWGINLSAVKALTATLDVMTIASARMAVAALALTVLLKLNGESFAVFRGRVGIGLFLCGFLMVYCNQILFSGGLARTSATHGALIMALSPTATTLLAAAALRERLSARRLAGVFLGFAGVALVVLNRPGATLGDGSIGDALILASVVCFAGGGIAVQKLTRDLSPLQVSWAVHVIGASMLALHALLESPSRLSIVAAAPAQTWALIAYSGIAATALAAIVWNVAIQRIGAARTAVAFYWVPIFGVGFAAVLLDEPLTWWHLVGLVSVLAGSRLASRR